nr:hypothetical protein [Tanacetum cinerariifolium]
EDQLDCVNPKGQQYLHNLLKPLPLIPNSQGRHVIPFDHFINNDLEYLRGGASSHSESKLGKSCKRVLGAVVGGSSACCVVVIVAMVEEVRVGADIGRGATDVEVCTSICEVV